MEKNEWMEKAAQCVMDGEEEALFQLVDDYLGEGLNPLEMIECGLSEGMRRLGDMFERGETFLPDLIIASEAMSKAVETLEQSLPAEEKTKKLGKVILGTVEGDVHDIGKGIVATLLKVHGFEVIDLGRDVPIATFVEKAKELEPDIVGSSALMTNTMLGQRVLEEALKEAGIRTKVCTIVGGAATTASWAKKIGADLHAEDSSEAVEKLKAILGS